MLKQLANVQVWVHDQDEALAFYTDKLGFELREDVTVREPRALPHLSRQPRLAPVLGGADGLPAPLGPAHQAARALETGAGSRRRSVSAASGKRSTERSPAATSAAPFAALIRPSCM